MRPAARTETSEAAAIRWPTSPFFQTNDTSHNRAKACTIEMIDGRSVPAELVAFEPDSGSMHVRLSGQSAITSMTFDRVLSLRLTDPLGLVPDQSVLEAVGSTTAHVTDKKPFVVVRKNGSRLSGTTLGFVSEKSGLFLYPVEYDDSLTFGLFVPSQHIKDMELGPRLGDTLVATAAVDRGMVDAALETQGEMRQLRIGAFLTSRAIVSGEDLSRALAEQRRHPNTRLGDVLIDAQLITPEQLQSALSVQTQQRGRRLGDILIEMGAVSMRVIQMALAEKLGIPFIDVQNFTIDPTTLDLVDDAFAVRHRLLPVLRTGESLVVAVENPLAIDWLQDLRFATALNIVPVMADPEDLGRRIGKEYGRMTGRRVDVLDWPAASKGPGRELGMDLSNVADLTSQLARESPQPVAATRVRETDNRISDNTLVRLINKIIMEAHSQGASDIHVESNPGTGHTRIRFRKDGELEDYLDLPPAYRNSLVSRIKIMAELNIAEHRQPQDGKIDFAKFGPLQIELRVAVIPTANSLEDVVLRILSGMEPLPLEQLGFCARDLSELKKMIVRSYGLILVCGPTGSGKTTTLHSALHDINKPDIKIWTAEDPIEITQAGLRQVQVQPKIDWTFAAAMRAFLRADPDVIMVGEMRDVETTKIGIEASLTGHLVFSTLHTNSAAESVVRLLDLGMDPFNFADALIGILSQRLARKLCSKCKRPHVATAKEIDDLLLEYCDGTTFDPAKVRDGWQRTFGADGGLRLWEPVGCKDCRKGYKGRIGVYELLVSTPRVKDLVRARAAVPQLVQAAMEGGMRLLRHDAIEKVWQGALDLHCARVASS